MAGRRKSTVSSTLSQTVGAPAPSTPTNTPISVEPKCYHSAKGVDYKGLNTAEAKASVSGAAALHAFGSALIATLDASDLTVRVFSETWHFTMVGTDGYKRTKARPNSYFTGVRNALKAYPTVPTNGTDAAAFLEIYHGNTGKKVAKGTGEEMSLEDTMKMVVSMAGTFFRRGGDIEVLVTALDAKAAEVAAEV